MRGLGAAAVLLGIFMFTGCGYVGPVLPPSPMIPVQVMDLVVIERGEQLVISFRTPPVTIDGVPIKQFSDVDLRAGFSPTPFDFERWADTAKLYPMPLPTIDDPGSPKPLPMLKTIPVSDWLGQRVAIAVRLSAKKGDHYSAWSNRVVLDVVEPLSAPAELRPQESSEGVVLDWQPVDRAKAHRLLRQSPGDKAPVVVASPESTHFVDTSAQFDTPYAYSVLATNGNAESLTSGIKEITPKDTFAPAVPGSVTVLAGPDSIEVSWQRSSEPDLHGYYIYRSVDGGEYSRQGDLQSLPTYSDKKVEHGKTYHYQITAIDNKNNESARSVAVQVAF